MAIDPIRGSGIGSIEPLSTERTGGANGANGAAGVDFGEALANAIGDARALEQTSQNLESRFAAGDPEVGMHETLIAAEKASIGLRYATTLKNRVLEAYRELMNTPV
jgi:flagellar hook-basal body complex protein FliE